MVKLTGKLEYGERAFLQDAEQAIRSDVVRALIELITNSDDAYGDSDGPINVRILPANDSSHSAEIRVSDAAIGLTAEGLEQRLAKLGVSKEASAAATARGLFGRGARDVASLGGLIFKAIRDDRYSELRINGLDYEFVAVDEPATQAHRQDLLLDTTQNGFTNVVSLDHRVRIPGGADLQRKLSEHAQLRDLVRRREVILFDGRGAGLHARLVPPTLPDPVFDEEIPVLGYDPVRLVLRRLPERSTKAMSDYSRHGLLVRSGVSVFENTWFGLEGRPEALHFCGEIDAPQIIAIIHAFDRKEELGGSTRLLKRDRDGLQRNHEYTKALSRAVQAAVAPTFEELAKSMAAERKEGAELANAFKAARHAIRDQLRQALEEIEDEDPTDGSGDGDAGFDDLMIIPPRRVLRPGAAVTLTVRARPALRGQALNADIALQTPSEVLDGAVASKAEWVDHPRLAAIVSNVYVTAGLQEGTAVVRVRVGDHTARADLIVLDQPDEEDVLPEALEFEKKESRVAPTRVRRIILRAPIEYVGSVVAFSVDGLGAFKPADGAILVADPTGRWSTASVRFTADATLGTSRITAFLDAMSDTCEITITDAAPPQGPDFEFHLSGMKDPSYRSSLTRREGALEIEVYGLHGSFAGLFGPYDDIAQKFSAEDQPEARAVLAEVLGAELAAYLLERDYIRNHERLNDATRILRRRLELQLRFQSILHRSLQPS
jgi:hypothetical protein